MPHRPEEKKQALTRIRRIKGQITSLEQALDADADCPAVLQQLAAVRGAINGLMATVLESYLREEFPSSEIRPNAGAYWTGQLLKRIFIGRDDDGSGDLDEEFELEFAWVNWHSDLEAWLAAPRFEGRPLISEWIEQRIA